MIASEKFIGKEIAVSLEIPEKLENSNTIEAISKAFKI